jgi:ribosome maturation protein Sdo1
MYNERMQILLSAEQRRRLEAEARRRDASVASVVRAAIDALAGAVPPERRAEALQRLGRRHAGFVPVAELNELIGSRGMGT